MKSFALTLAKPFVFVYNKTHWFTDKEAWDVFRFFAFAEAIGWTSLILAIVYRSLGLPEAPSVVSFAGHIHGMLFAVYFIIVIVVARSMEWGFWRVAGALIAGMPPYGSIIFEQWMAWHRKKYPANVTPPRNLED